MDGLDEADALPVAAPPPPAPDRVSITFTGPTIEAALRKALVTARYRLREFDVPS